MNWLLGICVCLQIFICSQCKSGAFPSEPLLSREAYGPSWKICIVTRSTVEIELYSSASQFILSTYSRWHGYSFVRNTTSSIANDFLYYPKLSIVLDQLDTMCDHVVWMDADFIPLSIVTPLEGVISRRPDAYVWISRDVSNIVNTGCFIVRNCAWTKRFLRHWIDYRHNPNAINDQTGFDFLYSTLSNEERNRIAILEPHELNSEAPAMTTLSPWHNFLHLAAEDNAYRAAVFEFARDTLKQALMQEIVPPASLGLSQDMLLRLALEIYGKQERETEELLNRAVRNSLEDEPQWSSQFARYRMALSKRLYAASALHLESPRIVSTARRKGFFLCATLLMSINNRLRAAGNVDMLPRFSVMITSQIEFSAKVVAVNAVAVSSLRSEMPELIKLTAELGYECLVIDTDSSHGPALYSLLRAMVADLLEVVHNSQRSIVEGMARELEFLQVSVDL